MGRTEIPRVAKLYFAPLLIRSCAHQFHLRMPQARPDPRKRKEIRFIQTRDSHSLWKSRWDLHQIFPVAGKDYFTFWKCFLNAPEAVRVFGRLDEYKRRRLGRFMLIERDPSHAVRPTEEMENMVHIGLRRIHDSHQGVGFRLCVQSHGFNLKSLPAENIHQPAEHDCIAIAFKSQQPLHWELQKRSIQPCVKSLHCCVRSGTLLRICPPSLKLVRPLPQVPDRVKSGFYACHCGRSELSMCSSSEKHSDASLSMTIQPFSAIPPRGRQALPPRPGSAAVPRPSPPDSRPVEQSDNSFQPDRPRSRSAAAPGRSGSRGRRLPRPLHAPRAKPESRRTRRAWQSRAKSSGQYHSSAFQRRFPATASPCRATGC